MLKNSEVLHIFIQQDLIMIFNLH